MIGRYCDISHENNYKWQNTDCKRYWSITFCPMFKFETFQTMCMCCCWYISVRILVYFLKLVVVGDGVCISIWPLSLRFRRRIKKQHRNKHLKSSLAWHTHHQTNCSMLLLHITKKKPFLIETVYHQGIQVQRDFVCHSI